MQIIDALSTAKQHCCVWFRYFLRHQTCANWAFIGCYSVVLLGAALRIWYVCEYNPAEHVWSDSQRHWEQGIDTLRNDPMTLTDPVMYQLYVAAIGKLSYKDPGLLAFYAILLSLLTPWVWYRFLREAQSSKLLATAAWAGLSVLPSWIAIYSYFMQETLFLPLLGCCLWATWRCKRKQTLGSFLCMVALWSVAGLTRGIAIPLAAVVCTWLWVLQGNRIRKAGYSLLILSLMLGPLTVRSYQQTGLLAPHGDGRLVGLYAKSGKFEIRVSYKRDGAQWNYIYGSPSMGSKPFEPLSDWGTAREGVAAANIDLRAGRKDWDTAFSRYPMSFRQYLWTTKENVIFLLWGASWPDNNPDRWLDRAAIDLRWLWAPLAVMLLVLTCSRRKELKGQWMLPAVLLTWFVIQGLVPLAVNEGRYRKPGEGLMLAHLVLLASCFRRRQFETLRNAEPNPRVVLPVVCVGLACILISYRTVQYLQTVSHLGPDGVLWLSDMVAVEHKQDWGQLGINATAVGTPLNLNGRVWPSGLGVHANSVSSYRIPSDAKYFHSYYGLTLDGKKGWASFMVELDGQEVFRSAPVSYFRPSEIEVELNGAEILTLRVLSEGPMDHDHAAWAMARFLEHPAVPLDALPAKRAR